MKISVSDVVTITTSISSSLSLLSSVAHFTSSILAKVAIVGNSKANSLSSSTQILIRRRPPRSSSSLEWRSSSKTSCLASDRHVGQFLSARVLFGHSHGLGHGHGVRSFSDLGEPFIRRRSYSLVYDYDDSLNLITSETTAEAGPAAAAETGEMPTKVLNVAEKNDAAKRIAGLLSNGTAQMRHGLATFNKLYEFPFQLMGDQVTMVMTSVSGHLLGYDFPSPYRGWNSVDPVELFDAPVEKKCPENFAECKRNLESQAAYAKILIIWTDCDREGENIGFEIIDVCKGINPRLKVFRAKFSEITPTAVRRAVNNLIQPNKAVSDAVDTRSELDLRIGAAFTRFQTLRLQRKFPSLLSDHLISYGSCQFPTLGFVVERYKAIQEFVPEDFWKIQVSHTVEQASVDFHWARVRLFNKLACRALLEKCLDNPLAKVVKVASKPKSKWRPVALDTVEFEKLASRKLRINAKEAMKAAEKLYTAGIISYPRTETNIFPQGLNLVPLVEMQVSDQVPWRNFAQRLLDEGPNPRNGNKSDQAHPPIHPTKLAVDLVGNEAKVYELIVRHFLACCSKDAKGLETTVDIEIAEEKFVANGLIILERNYLEVYPYDKWSDKELPHFQEGQTFMPDKIEMTESQTSPPNLLTEADLISLMEKHGIGTDATHAEHIETIKSRMYVGVQGDGKFVPGQLGMGLVEGYDSMGFQMSKPHLRAQLEIDLKGICDGIKSPAVVLRDQVASYKTVFMEAVQQVNKLDEAISQFLNQTPSAGSGGGGGGAGPRVPFSGGRGNNGPGGGSGPGSGRPGGPGPGPGGGGGPGRGGGGGSGQGPSGGASGGSSSSWAPPSKAPSASSSSSGGSNWARGQGSSGGASGGSSGSSWKPSQGPSGGGASAGGGSGSAWARGQGQAPSGGAGSSSGESPIPRCNCGMEAASLTVKKAGTNQGRFFFGCSRGMQDSCGFFAWDDEGVGQAAQQGPQRQGPRTPAYASRGGGRGRGQGPNQRQQWQGQQQQQQWHGQLSTRGGDFTRPTQTVKPRSRAKFSAPVVGAGDDGADRRSRRCGLCNELGHTRRTCPTREFEAEEYINTDGIF